MIAVLKRLAKFVLGDYGIYRIFRSPANDAGTADELKEVAGEPRFIEADAAALESAESKLLRDQAWYGGPDSWIFACLVDDRMVASSIVWYGERYKTRNFWLLRSNEAKLVQIVVDDRIRSRGIGTKLIRYTAAQVASKGMHACYARVWHSNAPSVAAFEKAGWTEIAMVVEFYPFGCGRPIRIKRRRN